MPTIEIQNQLDYEQRIRININILSRDMCFLQLYIFNQNIYKISSYLDTMNNLDEQDEEYMKMYNELTALYSKMMKAYNNIYKNNYDRFFTNNDYFITLRIIKNIQKYFQMYHNKSLSSVRIFFQEL